MNKNLKSLTLQIDEVVQYLILMIQRIQSVYLLLCSLVLGTNFLFPLAHSSTTSQKYFEDGAFNVMDDHLYLAVVAALILVSLITIFLYKKRRVQFWLITLCLFAAGFFAGGVITRLIKTEDYTLGFGAFTPLLAIVLLLLAYRSVRKDDKLVKSMDRLR